MTALLERVTTLEQAYRGSWYCIAGVGGDPQEWVAGYNAWLAEAEVGQPTRWLLATGAQVNAYAQQGGDVAEPATFRDDLTLLLFPLDGLNVSRLAMFKIAHGDRWLDDVIDNMRRAAL